MNSLYRLGELWKQTFTYSPIGIAIANSIGKFVMVNGTLCKMLGYSEDALTNYRWQELTHQEDIIQESGLLFDLVLGNINEYKIHKRYICKNGSIIAVISIVSAIRSPSNELQYILNQVMDVTELTRLKRIANSKLTPDLKADILLALSQKEFYLQYEAIRCVNTAKIIGHEGLIRWQHPQKGLIQPLAWIPVCEEDAELMAKICAYVVRQGYQDLANRNTWISVNISPKSLANQAFLAMLEDMAQIQDRPQLWLEITERSPLDNKVLSYIQSLGYGVLLDDFGQGHSSLIQLIEMVNLLPPSHFKVKIDGWFTGHISSKIALCVIKEFVEVLKKLNIEIIAECIETETQLKLWQELGIQMGQGWYWG